MKKLLLLMLLLVAWFAYTHRYRLFLRDPLGSVVRDGVAEAGAQVYENFGNDVLLENDHPPATLYLVQQGQPVSVPKSLKCLQFLVCLTSSYPEAQVFELPGARVESMTERQVRFQDERGREVDVRLR